MAGDSQNCVWKLARHNAAEHQFLCLALPYLRSSLARLWRGLVLGRPLLRRLLCLWLRRSLLSWCLALWWCLHMRMVERLRHGLHLRTISGASGTILQGAGTLSADDTCRQLLRCTPAELVGAAVVAVAGYTASAGGPAHTGVLQKQVGTAAQRVAAGRAAAGTGAAGRAQT